MIHLTTQQLSASLDRELGEAPEANVREHLSACAECASRMERLEDLEEKLIQSLRSDPEDSLFERIEREVEERTRPMARVPAGGVPAAGVPAAARAAAVPAAARAPAVPAAAAPVAAVPPVRQPADLASLREAARVAMPRPVERSYAPLALEPDSTPERRPFSFPWGVVILVLAGAAGIGALNFGAEFVPRWLGLTEIKERALPATAGALPAAEVEPQAEPAPPEEALLVEAPAVDPPAVEPAPRQPVQPRSAPGPSTRARVIEQESLIRPESDASGTADAAGPQAAGTGSHLSALEYEAVADSLEQVLGALLGEEFREARLGLDVVEVRDVYQFSCLLGDRPHDRWVAMP